MKKHSWKVVSFCSLLRFAFVLVVFVGSSVGFAFGNWTGGTVVDHDTKVVFDGATGFEISDDVVISGDVYLINEVPLTTNPFEIDITSTAFILSDNDAQGTPNKDYGHLLIYTGTCSQTIFNVHADLIFSGYNDLYGSPKTALTITFTGPGQVKFKMDSGRHVAFESLISWLDPTLDGYPSNWEEIHQNYTIQGVKGTEVFITMDQTYENAKELGQNKVVFERGAYDSKDTTKVTIGRNSFITFLHSNETGLLPCGVGSDEELGFGSIAFDPSNKDTGRMLLHLRGANYTDTTVTISGSMYEDGALVVAGHYVEDLYNTDAIRLDRNLNKPAGVEAIFRIVDEVAWQDSDYQSGSVLHKNSVGEPILDGTSDPSRRGLLVVNECKSVPFYAADTYKNNKWAEGSPQAGAQSSIRWGFVLGVNGSMEVFNNTFLDYVAASTQSLGYREVDFYDLEIAVSHRKSHNPSALLVDGLGILDRNNCDFTDPYNRERSLYYPYVAHFEENGGRHAQILLRGDARLYLRSGAKSNGEVDVGADWYITPSYVGGYLDGFDRLYSFTINKKDTSEGVFDGSFVSGLLSSGNLTYETEGEGNHVLDLEGKLTVRSTADNNSTDDAGFLIHKINEVIDPTASPCDLNRHVRSEGESRGAINLPPLRIDNTGREIRGDTRDIYSRPLTIGVNYPCYNSSSILMNAELALHNIHWHHNDVLKMATPEQDLAEPALVGGEKALYDRIYRSRLQTDNVYSDTATIFFVENALQGISTNVPLVSLYTSTLFLHESFASAGVRFVVTDKFEYEPDDPEGDAKLVSNVSHLICYNHGDSLDMLRRGYGRTVLFGTLQNRMSDGTLPGYYMHNSPINIYRGWDTRGNATNLGDGEYDIRLSLETDVQPRYVMQYETRDNSPLDEYSKLYDVDNLGSSLHQYKRVATQVFYLGNGSYTSLGWTMTNGDQLLAPSDLYPSPSFATDGVFSYSFGINEGFRPRPWDPRWSYTYTVGEARQLEDYIFSLTTDANDPAELYINGDNFYFGGRDSEGNKALEPAVGSNASCVFYANHGGKIHINQDTLSLDQDHYYDCFVDTVFAYRPWPRIQKDQTDATSPYIDGLSGIIDLPHDQVKFARSIQPYNLDFVQMLLANDGQTKETNVRLSVYDDKTHGAVPFNRKKASGEEVTIPWNFRVDKSTRIGTVESDPQFMPSKDFRGIFGLSNDYKTHSLDKSIYRSTKLAGDVAAVDMPDALLTVSTGDIITQMRVSGATKADPFHIYVTGGAEGHGIIREFTSLHSNYFNPGEGCHAAILVDGGGHFGLGSRGWNEHSNNAWSILGSDYVTIYPNGNGFVWVNSDLIVHDRLALIPTKNFGSYGNEKQILINPDEDQRLTFYSEIPREIRIPQGRELDLSAFGFPEAGGGTASSDYPQQIEIAGKLKLVFEAGSSLRFPASPDYQPVLYMNDEAEIIFEGAEDRDFRDNTDAGETDPYRTRILGSGQIWLNKNAKMRINDTAHVGVETDDETLTTSLVISIQRQSKLFVGDENVAGGALQIGNLTEDTVNNPEIYFKLILADDHSSVEVHREGFFGLGVGVINKKSNPNGNWQLQGLWGVKEIWIDVDKGVFDHNQIFDGDSRLSSLMAIGPSDIYRFNFGDYQEAIIRGGGNLLYIADAGEVYPSTLGADLVGSTASDDSVSARVTGDVNIVVPTGYLLQRGTSFSGTPSAFFNYLAQPNIATFRLSNPIYAALGRYGEKMIVGWVDGTTIVRLENPTVFGFWDPDTSHGRGALKVDYQPGVSTVADRIGGFTHSSV